MQKKAWGLITRRERWGLSWRGAAASVGLLLVAGVTFVFKIHGFLALDARVETRFLAVEGWIDANAMRAAAGEIRASSYERVFVTGGPVSGSGAYTNDFNTSASVGADLLKGVGVSEHLLQMVPSRTSDRDRTYDSAVALARWCRDHKVPLTSVNVLTADVHARRTRLLFQMALGDKVKVGIIAVPNPDYDAKRWWRYSEGVRSVVGECIAYAYARLLFHP